MDNEKPEPSQDALQLAGSLQQMLEGEEVNEGHGKWHISNSNSPRIVNLFFQGGDAIYSFAVEPEGDVVTFENLHREAATGQGTPSLRSLEESFALTAMQLGRTVRVTFPIFGQADTRAWLTKNGYSAGKEGAEAEYMVKEFKR